MASAGGFPAVDITDRMALFGRLFGEEVGVQESASLPSLQDLIGIVKRRVPRAGAATDEAPVFEAAAFVGEWLRSRAEAIWVAEGPFEPHLQLVDASRAIVVLVPLVSIMRTSASAGYDGLAEALARVLSDVERSATRRPLERLLVEPPEDRARVVAWVERHRHVRESARAALWRRCAACGSLDEEDAVVEGVGGHWETEAAAAATLLSRRPFACACGGLPGDTSRFLMLRATEGATRLCDIHVNALRSRVATWTILPSEAVPFDATALASLTGPG